MMRETRNVNVAPIEKRLPSYWPVTSDSTISTIWQLKLLVVYTADVEFCIEIACLVSRL